MNALILSFAIATFFFTVAGWAFVIGFGMLYEHVKENKDVDMILVVFLTTLGGFCVTMAVFSVVSILTVGVV